MNSMPYLGATAKIHSIASGVAGRARPGIDVCWLLHLVALD
ncbi:hypothetical protein ACWATR_29540 [Nostoc sp. UIC 10890]